MRVVVSDHIFTDLSIEKEMLESQGIAMTDASKMDEEALMEATREADGMLVCFREISQELVDNMQQCKVIARYGIGFNNVPVETASRKKIMVTNVPDYCVDEVSDHAISLILACTRKVVALHNLVKSGVWDHKPEMPIYRLKGQRLGLVGFGKIAREVGRKAQALGFEIVAFDPFVSEEEMKDASVVKVDLDTLMKTSFVISVHAPLTDQTRHMISAPQLALMRKDAFIVNTSRGALINEKDLLDALNNRRIAGAGLDVLESEDFDPNNPILKAKNLVLTPHAAFYSEDSEVELRQKAVGCVISALKGETPPYVVNARQLGL